MSEKRHFKIFTSKHVIGDENKYVLLFDAIDSQHDYDEKVLLKKKEFRKLSLLKNRLYEIILKSLRAFYSTASVNIQMKSALHNIEILFEKDLYEHCDKILKRTKQLAVEYDNYIVWLELLKWEFKLMRARSFLGKTEEDVNKIYEEIFCVTDKFSYTNRYAHAFARLFVKSMKKGFPRTKEGLKEYENIMNSPLFSSGDIESNYFAMYAFYYSNMFFAYIKNDYKKAYDYAHKLIRLIEENPHQIEEDPKGYISASHGLMVYQGHLDRYSETLETIKKMRKIKPRTKHIQNLLFYTTVNMEMATYICNGDYETGVRRIKEIEEEKNSQQLKISNRQDEAVLEYNKACICFGAGNYKTANFYLNKILNDSTIDFRTDLHCFARIFSLLIHFELGNEDLLEYAVKSTFRYLYKRNRLYRFETLILNFVKKLSKNDTPDKLLESFKNLKSAIEETAKLPFENKVFDYFDFISWLESKITKRSFAEIVKEKAEIAELKSIEIYD